MRTIKFALLLATPVPCRRELEEDGIVRREAFAELPPRVEYSLTEYGEALLPIIDQLSTWHSASPVVAAGGQEGSAPGHCPG